MAGAVARVDVSGAVRENPEPGDGRAAAVVSRTLADHARGTVRLAASAGSLARSRSSRSCSGSDVPSGPQALVTAAGAGGDHGNRSSVGLSLLRHFRAGAGGGRPATVLRRRWRT